MRLKLDYSSDPIENKQHLLLKKVFSTEEGKEVFDLLTDFSCLFLYNIHLTPYQSAWMEGRRSLMLDIANITRGVSKEQLKQYEQQQQQIKKGVFPWNLPTTQQEQQKSPWTWALW